jgi:hypothetical protein
VNAPHASRVDYDHCGHVAFVEAAEEFNRDVAAFMQFVAIVKKILSFSMILLATGQGRCAR